MRGWGIARRRSSSAHGHSIPKDRPCVPPLKGVIAALNTEKKKRDASETATAEWYKSLEPKLLKIGTVTLTPSTEAGKSSGLTFHYPPYAVGPYAEGEYVAFVPWESLSLV